VSNLCVSLPSSRVYLNASVENGGRDVKPLDSSWPKVRNLTLREPSEHFKFKAFSREAE
jgi:hypothetical protein